MRERVEVFQPRDGGAEIPADRTDEAGGGGEIAGRSPDHGRTPSRERPRPQRAGQEKQPAGDADEGEKAEIHRGGEPGVEGDEQGCGEQPPARIGPRDEDEQGAERFEGEGGVGEDTEQAGPGEQGAAERAGVGFLAQRHRDGIAGGAPRGVVFVNDIGPINEHHLEQQRGGGDGEHG